MNKLDWPRLDRLIHFSKHTLVLVSENKNTVINHEACRCNNGFENSAQVSSSSGPSQPEEDSQVQNLNEEGIADDEKMKLGRAESTTWTRFTHEDTPLPINMSARIEIRDWITMRKEKALLFTSTNTSHFELFWTLKKHLKVWTGMKQTRKRNKSRQLLKVQGRRVHNRPREKDRLWVSLI